MIRKAYYERAIMPNGKYKNWRINSVPIKYLSSYYKRRSKNNIQDDVFMACLEYHLNKNDISIESLEDDKYEVKEGWTYVYCVKAKGEMDHDKDYYKIGIATNLEKRLTNIKVSNHLEVEIIKTWHLPDNAFLHPYFFNAKFIEKRLHEWFGLFGRNVRGEWFDINLCMDELVDELDDAYDYFNNFEYWDWTGITGLEKLEDHIQCCLYLDEEYDDSQISEIHNKKIECYESWRDFADMYNED